MIELYKASYLGRKHASTRPFRGVVEALSRLGGRKTTATTKGTPTTRAVLEQFGLLTFFDHVQGTDGFPCKPAPDVLLRSIEVMGAKPEECLFIGDSEADMEAGRRAGIHICAVDYGYGNPEALARWSPDYQNLRPARTPLIASRLISTGGGSQRKMKFVTGLIHRLCIPEVSCAVHRRYRERQLTRPQARALTASFRSHIELGDLEPDSGVRIPPVGCA